MNCTSSGLAGSPVEIFCSNPAAQQLKSSLPGDLLQKYYKITIVKGDDCLDLGGGACVFNHHRVSVLLDVGISISLLWI